ncbi:hypothetical protein R1T08_02245 [Streptomyces sp. SBC-4]|nr:hypothetical protein [Streptomyces sp. SBC-4]MDV5143161.1 hypothetical protein [Streptomyces sp. SBC-4]
MTQPTPTIRCATTDCGNTTTHPDAKTIADVRRLNRTWRQRAGGRDLCPDCWKAGRR